MSRLPKPLSVAVVLLVACGTVLGLTPVAGASPGTDSSTSTTPGPCEDGWVAPTPTVVAVTAVPITVTSTVDDYFVLYRKHDRGSDTVVNIPVSVTRGEAGTTALSDNLAPLSADWYSVEKYRIDTPADVDGDCVDDIAELADLGYRNPTNPAFPAYAEHGSVALPDRAAFEKFSYQGESPGSSDKHLTGVEILKFIVVNIYSDNPKIWFQNTNRHRGHWGRWGFRQAGLSRVIQCCWSGFGYGVIAFHPNAVAPDGSLGVYRWEFQPWDSWDFRKVERVHEALAAAMPFIEDNLAYYPFAGRRPRQQYEAQKSLYDASRVNILQSKDIFPDVPYTVYNVNKGYGLLRVVEPGEVPGGRDVVVLRALPNDLPRVAG
ncbi:MAG: hypothetical protein OXF75_01890, partial [Acidimicrobiaceae bacterium]|nr:hypothetical protein [Acidimicrobiaceae bacterium]